MQEPPEGLTVTPCHNFCQEWRIYCIYLCCCSCASSDFGNPWVVAPQRELERKTRDSYLKFASDLSASSLTTSANVSLVCRLLSCCVSLSTTNFVWGMDPFLLHDAADYLEQLANGSQAREALLPIGLLPVIRISGSQCQYDMCCVVAIQKWGFSLQWVPELVKQGACRDVRTRDKTWTWPFP